MYFKTQTFVISANLTYNSIIKLNKTGSYSQV